LKDNWVILYPPDIYDVVNSLSALLQAHGAYYPEEFVIYGKIKTFLLANGLPTNQVIAFHKGYFIGNYDTVKGYLKDIA
jgi:hypothetical protein